MIEIGLYSSKSYKTSFSWLWKNEVAVFKLLLNLLQIDYTINKMLFWPKLLFVKGISKATCDLVLCVFLEGTKRSFTYN